MGKVARLYRVGRGERKSPGFQIDTLTVPKPECTWCVRRLQEATPVRVELGEETFALTLCKRGAMGEVLRVPAWSHTFFMGYFWLLWAQEQEEGCIMRLLYSRAQKPGRLANAPCFLTNKMKKKTQLYEAKIS